MANRWTPAGTLLAAAYSILIRNALSVVTPSGGLGSSAVTAVLTLPNSTFVPADKNSTGRWVSSTIESTLTADPVGLDVCLPLGSQGYKPIPTVISVAAALCGCVMLLAGYRIYRMSFLVGGSALGMVLSYVSLDQSDALQRFGIVAAVCIVVAVGVLLGLCTALLPVVGHVTIAMSCGLLLAVTVLTIVAVLYGPLTTVVAAITMATTAAVAGVASALALRHPRHQAAAAVTCTAAMGAALVVVCLDYFVELSILLAGMYSVLLRGGQAEQLSTVPLSITGQPPPALPVTSDSPVLTSAAAGVGDDELTRVGGSLIGLTPPCFYTWILVAAWPLLTAIGMLIQCNVTAKHVDPFTGLWCVKRRRASVTKSSAEEQQGDEATWERYRHIYTARRSAGDVVATAYSKGGKKFARVRGTPLQSDTDDEGSWSPVNGSCKV